MKKIVLVLLINILFSTILQAQEYNTIDPKKKTEKAEVSCGECKFKMKGKGCHLAVRIKGKAYWVDGAHIESFGDAHDKKMGFCNAIRKAEIQGDLKGERYVLSYLKFTDVKRAR